MPVMARPARRRFGMAGHPFHGVARIDARRMLWQTLLLGLVFTPLLLTPAFIQERSDARQHLVLRQSEQERALKLGAQIIRQEMEAVLSDLRYLSQHNDLAAYLESSDPLRRRDLALEYLGLARHKRIYDRIRFIGLDGHEEVRVDFADGAPLIRPPEALRDQSSRYYVREAQWLSPGEIYVSPFDLDVEHERARQAPWPVIRFALPAADGQGMIRGMVVLDYQGRRLLDKLRMLAGQAGDIWLLNADGYWLLGPNGAQTWGFVSDSDGQAHAARHFPEFWRLAAVSDTGNLREGDFAIRFERVYPLRGDDDGAADRPRPVAAPDYHWVLAAALAPAANRPALASGTRWPVYGGLTLFAFAAAAGLAFALNRNRALALFMENIVDNLPVLVSYVDAEERYRFNNLAYQRFFQRDVTEIEGVSMRELLGDAAYQDVRPYIKRVLAGEAVTFERQVEYAGAGTRDVAVSYLPDVTSFGEVRGFYVLVSDVSMIKQSERRERSRMLELAHASRLSSMGEMATQLAHEINQPLAAISMYSAAALRTLQGEWDARQLREWLQTIHGQAVRAGDILRRVRRFVRRQDMQRVPVDLNGRVCEVVDLLRSEARSREVAVYLDLHEDLPHVPADPVLIEQVVFNLVRNALDALQERAPPRVVTLSSARAGDRVYVEVRDNGPGVDAALGARIFDSFVSSKGEGVGMGLAISRSIIEAHGGRLDYQANAEGGATFRFELPLESPT
jgi:signal transduction histidine kinase